MFLDTEERFLDALPTSSVRYEERSLRVDSGHWPHRAESGHPTPRSPTKPVRGAQSHRRPAYASLTLRGVVSARPLSSSVEPGTAHVGATDPASRRYRLGSDRVAVPVHANVDGANRARLLQSVRYRGKDAARKVPQIAFGLGGMSICAVGCRVRPDAPPHGRNEAAPLLTATTRSRRRPSRHVGRRPRVVGSCRRNRRGAAVAPIDRIDVVECFVPLGGRVPRPDRTP